MKAFKFSSGAHATREDGMCVMETVAYLAGEPHSYVPKCADMAICNLAILVNDNTTDEIRNEMLQDLPWRIVGTANPLFNLERWNMLMECYKELFGIDRIPAGFRRQGDFVGWSPTGYCSSPNMLKDAYNYNTMHCSTFATICKKYLNKMILFTEIKETPNGVEKMEAEVV